MKFTSRPMINPRGLVLALIAAAMLVPALQAAGTAPEDPAALAAIYTQQAAELRASAEKHAKIAKVHKAGAGGPKTSHESIAQHCERIAESLRAAAQESEALAATYRSLAEKQ